MGRISNDIPLVSIITPVYNSPDLRGSIDSVLAQNYGAIEYIIVDDHSEQFCISEIYQYIKTRCKQNIKRFLIVENETNEGTVRTMNRGFQLATGKYFFQLAGDDEFADSAAIEDWVTAFQQKGSLVMTARRANYDTQLKKCLGTSPNKKQIQMLRQLPPKKLYEKLTAVNFIFGCCTAYDGSFMRRMGFYDTRYRLIEDYPMNLRLLRSGIKIDFFDRVVVNYRGGGISSAEKYNNAYEQDADLIFQNEVIPYTKEPTKATARYQAWKKYQLQMKQYQQRRLETQGKPLRTAMIKLKFYATHPIRTTKNILEDPGKLQRVFGRLYKGDL